MTNNKPEDRVLTWVVPLLPAATAFVLLWLMLVATERMLAEEFKQRSSARVEQVSRLYAAQLSRSTEAWADPLQTGTTVFEELRQHVLGPEKSRRQLNLAVVDEQGHTWIGDQLPISRSEWHALQADPEGATRTLLSDSGETYLVARARIALEGIPPQIAWQAVSAQPLHAVLAPVRQLRHNLLAWGGSITLLLALGGLGLSYHLVLTQRRNRERLRDQRALLQAALNSAGDAIISVDLAGRITQFNPVAERMFGHSVTAMLGQPLDVLLPQAPTADRLIRIAQSRSTSGPKGRVTGVRADGQALELEAAVSQMTMLDDTRVTAILRDVTERVRSERALAQQQQALTELNHRLLLQEKHTTRKLAQALHDQLGQTLGAMRLSFDAMLSMLPEPLTPKLRDRSRVLGQLIDTSNAQVRQALVALRPPLLDEEGLQAALRHEVHSRALDAEPVVLRFDLAPEVARMRWPADVEHAAFMVAREAMANALLHANAHSVVLRVVGNADLLQLSVTDDGVGLNPDMAAGRAGHLGIVGMRERALAIGARLNVQSLTGGGTVVSLIWEIAPATPLSKSHTQDIDCATLPHHE